MILTTAAAAATTEFHNVSYFISMVVLILMVPVLLLIHFIFFFSIFSKINGVMSNRRAGSFFHCAQSYRCKTKSTSPTYVSSRLMIIFVLSFELPIFSPRFFLSFSSYYTYTHIH